MRPVVYPVSTLIAGILTPFSIAPFNHWWLGLLTLAVFAFNLNRTHTKKQSLLHGFLFGLGLFGAGASWVCVSIYEYGSAPLPLALLLTALFVTFVALIFALPFYLLGIFKANHWRLLLGFPLLWTLSEWLRTWLLTGFPWLFIGYGQMQTPLIGWAPVGGVLLISLLTAFTSSTLSNLVFNRRSALNIKLLSVIAVVILWSEGAALKSVEWTQAAGEPLTVGIVQPNIPQELKWDPDFREPTAEILTLLSEDLWQHDWVVWPEAAVPDIYSRSLGLLENLEATAQQTNTSLITGILYDDVNEKKYFNTIIGLGKSEGTYHKQRLVPFGEYVPLEAWLRGLIAFFDLPTSIISSGHGQQTGLISDDYEIASAICYEIVYPSLVAGQAKDRHVILTISNDAWFGESIGPLQHFHMARMRAIETRRYVVRATNNGVSAIIDPYGDIIGESAQFTRTNLSGKFIPMEGNTPFIIWKNNLVLVLLILIFCGLIYQNSRDTN